MTRAWVRNGVLVLAFAVLLGGAPVSATAGDKETPTLKGLLAKAELSYTETRGVLKVPVEYGTDTTMVYAHEKALSKLGKVVYMYCFVLRLEEPASLRLLRSVGRLNGELLIGNIGVSSSAVTFNTSFWLDKGDVETLKRHLLLSHLQRLRLAKELRPYTTDE